jgi:hypothetical protein
MMGTETDPSDHPATSMPNATQHYAGDVIPMPGEKSMGSGLDSRAVDYAIGKKTDPKVVPMPIGTTHGWAKRTAS